MSTIQQNVIDALTRFAADFSIAAEALRRSTVQIRGRRYGTGSGVIWHSDGLIITNSHVVRGSHAQVRLSDGRSFEATVTKRDGRRDLATLMIPANNLPVITIGDSDSLRVGELALAVGNPFGQAGVLTTGIIHTISQRWVQADLRLAPGNSGGPLANARGAVIGINSMIAGGLALAVPSKTVERFLIRGSEDRPRLGITMQPLPVPLDGEHVLGLLLFDIRGGSAAEKGGLMIGDILIGSGGHLFNAPDDLTMALEMAGDGSTALELDLIRGGKRMTRTVPIPTGKDVAEAA